MTKTVTLTVGGDKAKWMKATYEVVWEYQEATPLVGNIKQFKDLETGKELASKLQCTFEYRAAVKDALNEYLAVQEQERLQKQKEAEKEEQANADDNQDN